MVFTFILHLGKNVLTADNEHIERKPILLATRSHLWHRQARRSL